jgi:hypothetical protein
LQVREYRFTKNGDEPTSFTSVGNEADLALKWMTTALPDHLVRLEEDGWGDRQAQRLGCLEVEDQLEFRGLLDGQVPGLGALEETGFPCWWIREHIPKV